MAIKNYSLNMDEAYAGMLYDLSDKQIDTFAVEDTDGISAGAAVIRGTEPAKQVKAANASGDGAKVIGVVLHTHKELVSSGKYYEKGYAVPVVTKGRIYVNVGGAVTAGKTANIKLTDGTFVEDAVASGIEAVGCGAKFITSTSAAGVAVVELG